MAGAPCWRRRVKAPLSRVRLAEDPETLYGVKASSLTVGETLGGYLTARLVYFRCQGSEALLAESWNRQRRPKQITFKLHAA